MNYKEQKAWQKKYERINGKFRNLSRAYKRRHKRLATLQAMLNADPVAEHKLNMYRYIIKMVDNQVACIKALKKLRPDRVYTVYDHSIPGAEVFQPVPPLRITSPKLGDNLTKKP